MLKRAFILCLAAVLSSCGVQNAAVYYDAVALSAKQPDAESAIRNYEKTVKKSVHSQHYYAAMGDIYASYGEYGRAVNEYTKSLRNSDSEDVHMKRGRAYMKLGFYPDAAYDFGAATISGDDTKYIAYAERAKAYIELGKYPEALKDIDRARGHTGSSAELDTAMAEIFFKTADYAKAGEYIQRAVAADSGNANLYYLRGKIYYKTKDANQAITDFKKAVGLNDGFTAAKYQLAWVLAACPVSIYRDGQKATELAEELYGKSQSSDNALLLAAAYAGAGAFDKAKALLRTAAEKEKDFVKQDDMRVYLKAYEEKRTINTW